MSHTSWARGSIPPQEKKWYNRTVDEILNNEKYIGDVILVKSISPGGIGSKRIKNAGFAEQYKMDHSHTAIISRETFEAIQTEKRRSNYVCVNQLGVRTSPSYITNAFPGFLKRKGMRVIRFHGLRHPDVKQATKIMGIFKHYCGGNRLHEASYILILNSTYKSVLKGGFDFNLVTMKNTNLIHRAFS